MHIHYKWIQYYLIVQLMIMSISSFSYLPALLNTTGRIYHNNKFWNKPLNSFNVYDDDTGLIFQ